MSTASVADFVESLRKSRFLDAARLDKVVSARERFPDAVTLAKELVRKGWLTREQAQQLLQGRPTEPPATVPTQPQDAPQPTAPTVPSSRRSPWPLILLLLLLLGGAAGFGWWWHSHHGANDGQANASGRSNDSQQGSPIGSCTDTSRLKTMDDLVFGDPVRAKFDPKFLDALKDKPIPDIERYPAWQPKELVAVLGEHRMRNSLVAPNPDGTLLAVGGDQDSYIRIGPVETLHEKIVLSGHNGGLYALAWSPKGDVLASASSDGTVRLWDVHDLEQIPPPKVLEQWQVTCLAFSADGKYLIGGSASSADLPGQGFLWIWDVEKRERRLKRRTNTPLGSVAVSPVAGDYRVLWGGGPDDAKIYLWDYNPELGKDGKELAIVDIRDPDKNIRKVDSRSSVGSVGFSPDGKRAVTAVNRLNPVDGNGVWSVHVWDLDDFQEGHAKRILTGFSGDPIPVFAPDGKSIATARRSDNSVVLWDAAAGTLVRTLTNAPGIWSLRFMPRSERVILTSSISNDRNIHIHEAATGKEVRPPIGHLTYVRSVSGSPDGRRVASGGYDYQARIWDLDTLDGPPPVGAGGVVWQADFHPDGSKAFFCGEGTALVPFLDAQTGKDAAPPYREPRDGEDHRHFGGITNAAVSEDGHYLLTGGFKDGKVRLWDFKDGKQVREFPAPAGGPATVSLAPDGKRALRSFGHHPSAVKDSVALLHLRCQQQIREWNGGSWNTYLPDGHIAIIGDAEAAEGKIIDVSEDGSKDAGTLGIKLAGASAGSITRDGNRLATLLGGRAVVFDLSSKKLVWEWTPPTHFHGLSAVALSEDGRYLFTANGDGTVYVIQLPQKNPNIEIRNPNEIGNQKSQ